MTPASIRNNNPGAMEPGPSSRKFGSAAYETLRWSHEGKPRENRIATFATPQHGAAAQFDLLHRKYAGMPLRDAVTKWCGSYWAGPYAAALEKRCGLAGDEILTREMVRDPAIAIPLCQAMARVEAGRDFPMDHAGWQAAHTMAFAAALAPAPSPSNDVPYQKPEARRRAIVRTVGKAVGAAGTVGVVADGASDTVGVVRPLIPPVPSSVTDALSNGVAIKEAGKTAVGLGQEAWGLAAAFPWLAGAVVILGAAFFFFTRGEHGKST